MTCIIENNKSFFKLIENSIKKNWNLAALTDYEKDPLLYKDLFCKIKQLHLIYEEAEIEKGDKISIIGKNSSSWVVSLLSIMTYGAVAVPILHEFNPVNVIDIVIHSESKILFSTDEIFIKLNLEKIPEIINISLNNLQIREENKDKGLRDKINYIIKNTSFDELTISNVKFREDQPEELALINYTSGTTGSSKGVMLPYRSLWSNTEFASKGLDFLTPGDNIISMLPLAHMYGLAFDIFNGINMGCNINFIPSLPSPSLIIDFFKKKKPKLIIMVPLIIEKIIKSNVFPFLKKPFINTAYKAPILNSIINKIIAKKLNNLFGGNFHQIIIGGAALDINVEKLLKKIKFKYTTGYGMTECGPLISYIPWDKHQISSVGKCIDRMQVKIDNYDPTLNVGEIMVKGENVMIGFYKNPELTAASFDKDKWLYTGDLGHFDDDQNIYIRGRSKTMILGPSGQNIYPEEIESIINNHKFISEILVIYKENKLMALVYPNIDNSTNLNDIHEKIKKHVMDSNKLLPAYSKISDVKFVDKPFEKTPKQSIKRFLYY